MEFSEAESAACKQAIQCNHSTVVSLDFVKFQNLSHLTVRHFVVVGVVVVVVVVVVFVVAVVVVGGCFINNKSRRFLSPIILAAKILPRYLV